MLLYFQETLLSSSPHEITPRPPLLKVQERIHIVHPRVVRGVRIPADLPVTLTWGENLVRDDPPFPKHMPSLSAFCSQMSRGYGSHLLVSMLIQRTADITLCLSRYYYASPPVILFFIASPSIPHLFRFTPAPRISGYETAASKTKKSSL